MRLRTPSRLAPRRLARPRPRRLRRRRQRRASRITAAPGTSSRRRCPPAAAAATSTIASANFPENQILAEVYRQALAGAGYTATVKSLTTRPVILKALESGDVQVEPDYVGSLAEYLRRRRTAATTSASTTATWTPPTPRPWSSARRRA